MIFGPAKKIEALLFASPLETKTDAEKKCFSYGTFNWEAASVLKVSVNLVPRFL